MSLGGCNDFTIDVGKKINNDLGDKIDGRIYEDFLIKFRQLQFDNKGHSRKPTILKVRGKVNNRPVTWKLTKNESKIFDHYDKKILTHTPEIEVRTSLDLYIRIKFACKVALATGYYLFGNNFLEYADCETLRKAMLSENLSDEKLDIRVYDELLYQKDDEGIAEFHKRLFKYLGCSLVCFTYTPGRICSSVSINGTYISMVNFKADLDKLDLNTDLHRAGTVMMCKDKKLIQKSVWQCTVDMSRDLKIFDFIDSEVNADEHL